MVGVCGCGDFDVSGSCLLGEMSAGWGIVCEGYRGVALRLYGV